MLKRLITRLNNKKWYLNVRIRIPVPYGKLIVLTVSSGALFALYRLVLVLLNTYYPAFIGKLREGYTHQTQEYPTV